MNDYQYETKINWNDILIIGAVVIGGYLLIKNKFLSVRVKQLKTKVTKQKTKFKGKQGKKIGTRKNSKVQGYNL